MLKGVRLAGPGGPLLVLGLSRENVRRLTNGGDEGLGEPIRFNMAELGLRPMWVVIYAADTDEELREIGVRFGLLGEDA